MTSDAINTVITAVCSVLPYEAEKHIEHLNSSATDEDIERITQEQNPIPDTPGLNEYGEIVIEKNELTVYSDQNGQLTIDEEEVNIW